MRWSVLMLCAALAAGSEMPPSPSLATGERIWPTPAFTHWPAIAYADERRNAAVGLPVRTRGAAATWGWEGGVDIALRLPDEVDQTSGLVELLLSPSRRVLRVALPDGEHRLPLRIESAAAPQWSIVRLVDGYPVDASGTPVVLLATRPQPARERTWALLRADPPRPGGRPLIVGDPLEAMHDSPWQGLDAELRSATDPIRPHHACLVALAQLPDPLPRTIIWCPGNAAIVSGEMDPEEPRLLGAVREHCIARGGLPLLVVALPPRPVEERLHAAHDVRREALVAEADRTGWRILDLGRAAGDPERANRVGDAVYTAYPAGEALGRVREMLRAAVAK